jgi:hypothetical protein
MSRTIALSMLLAFALCLPALGRGTGPEPATAARTVSESREAAPDGVVSVRTYAGSVTIRGWDKPSVRVTGTIGRDIVELELVSVDGKTSIETVPPDRRQITATIQVESELVIDIPARSSLFVSTLAADVTVRNVDGAVQCDTLGGNIDVAGAPGLVNVRTFSGSIAVAGPAARVSFEAMGRPRVGESGGVVIDGAVPEVMGSTLGADVRIRTSVMKDYDISTVSGHVTLDGALAEDGRVKVEGELNGSVELVLPADVRGTFTLSCPTELVDMKEFKPTADVTWVFRSESDSLSARERVRSSTAGTRDEAGLLRLPALPRIVLGGSFQEFTVGAPGKARVLLDIGPFFRGGPSDTGLVLRTK